MHRLVFASVLPQQVFSHGEWCLQIVKFIEKILYAGDEGEAKEAMLEAQQTYDAPTTDNHADAAVAEPEEEAAQ